MRHCFALGLALATSVEGFLPAVSEMRVRRGGKRLLPTSSSVHAAGICREWSHTTLTICELQACSAIARRLYESVPSDGVHNLSRLSI